MRIGVTVPLGTVPPAEVAGVAAAVEAAALDLVWLDAADGQESPEAALVAAASCAEGTRTLLVGAGTSVTGHNPLYLAEERHVADQLLGGRLVLGLRGDDYDRLSEWTGFLLSAAANVPFFHRGAEHAVPAGLPQHTVNPEQRVRVMPAPQSLEPPLWLLGDAATPVAAQYALSPVVERDGSAVWRRVADRLGSAARRLRRPAFRAWDPGREDAAALATRLRAERDDWGLDTALLRLDPATGSAAWRAAVADLASVVRPRLQQDRLPAGLEELWDAERRAHPCPRVE
ncbi:MULTISPECIES: LLM class flavin-dependent oxidoreductase [Prauserella salsuginis group]|uniref:LLM class flavin-dependent oxidoreductase n=1 Tax=Prauserella salsuginis TaxID=387889 RepID=A0ABW6G4T5_9PSEU|nr:MULTISPECIES: LLM class flavin-dependent oxidoreductase [Prauserella salsuginis group]MCR3718768.1 Flavin-dependent oxidoreductase, luciferase family (includes alkanesulfonate monooxygenase SsuD and methylene tetrahydromethanopterin reductase) [Prauserella flava]MCR3733338.1 Flavin-dependent oxidoreductase, luciferase family (includes alkanesulfonate monooxygenase SsuD and methylene tetrahydromethanopterin reductase) [Prauserella salsuginis]